ncbi:SLBB domain-containing protein [Hydrogenimonas thermophila]|uniref:SLBB domain-containing protein n=1 Tax=Hydrogenimonas thermophila TaxID=223786 RepID=UPI002936E469|nr:SLBB domain-containing protein [Hydrogenimonas thermophila]WOE69001.1 SLBB domain-containing protein [Hydrogenimonas thermophila]WOE71512.1 SLBB domain-containing protein [Hydrogenimonas thermophila]
MILRLTPQLEEKLISFNLKDALNGKISIPLQSGDEIYIFNKLSIFPPSTISISGECITHPGSYRYVEGITIWDAITVAGLSCPIDQEHIRITSYDPLTSQPSTRVVNLKKDINIALNPSDEIHLYSALATNPPKKATITGEVYNPGSYPIDENTTIKELVLAAGGLTDRAGDKVEVVHYIVENNERKRIIEQLSKSIIMSNKSPIVKNYDEIRIFKIPYWSKKKTVTIKGQVLYPGTYPIEEGDRLADIIKRAGGFTNNAFIEGAVFTRKDIKQMQEKGLQREVKELEKRITYIAASPSQAGEKSGDKQVLIALLDNLKQEVKNISMTGRIVIKLDQDLNKFAKTPYNIVLKDGDALYIPPQEDSIVVLGEVMNPSAQIYTPNFTYSDYIEHCGGIKHSADTDTIYVIHANGEAEKIETGFFFAGNVKIKKGDTIVVPMKIETISNIQLAKDITSIFYQLAVSAAALKTIGSL